MNSLLVPQKPKRNSDQSIIPMINIVFLLLIFFMVAGQIKTSTWSDISLPKLTDGAVLAPDPISLKMDAAGGLSINQQVLVIDELAETLTPLLLNNPHLALVADKSLSAAQLHEVLVVVRGLGVAKLVLITQPKHN